VDLPTLRRQLRIPGDDFRYRKTRKLSLELHIIKWGDAFFVDVMGQEAPADARAFPHEDT
jgi:hypothetical protein